MRYRCFICNKNLSKTLTILDAKYTLRNWNSYYDNKEYILYFSKNNMSTCVPCGKQYFKWFLSRNKPTLINNRQIRGKNIKLAKIPCNQFANCVFCRTPTQYKETDPLDTRKYYLASVGQCCPYCYIGIHNTSTAYINSSDEELYL